MQKWFFDAHLPVWIPPPFDYLTQNPDFAQFYVPQSTLRAYPSFLFQSGPLVLGQLHLFPTIHRRLPSLSIQPRTGFPPDGHKRSFWGPSAFTREVTRKIPTKSFFSIVPLSSLRTGPVKLVKDLFAHFYFSVSPPIESDMSQYSQL